MIQSQNSFPFLKTHFPTHYFEFQPYWTTVVSLGRVSLPISQYLHLCPSHHLDHPFLHLHSLKYSLFLKAHLKFCLFHELSPNSPKQNRYLPSPVFPSHIPPNFHSKVLCFFLYLMGCIYVCKLRQVILLKGNPWLIYACI